MLTLIGAHSQQLFPGGGELHLLLAELARNRVKTIKKSKIKVQAAIQGDKLRVSGKKRDDLQATIRLLRETDVNLPLQYENFRD